MKEVESSEAQTRLSELVNQIANCPACCSPARAGRLNIPDREYGFDYLAAYACCSQCQTLYQAPMPSDKQLSSFYPADYHSVIGAGVLQQIRHSMRIHQLKKMVRQGDNVLDFGCGNGSFLRSAAVAIPTANFIGYEIADQERTEEIAPRVTRLQGRFESCFAKLPSCRVIIMNHVIEHLPEPFAIVSKLREKLLDGGYFDGQTPNSVSLEHKLFGQFWSGFHAPRHTVIFSAAGLRCLLERAGFAQVQIQAAFNPAGYAVSFASLFQRNGAGKIPRQGLKWLLYLAAATLVLPIDFWSGIPGIINFRGSNKN